MKTTRNALLILALTLGSAVVHAQDAKAPKGKQSEKAPKKDKTDKAPPPVVFDFSEPSEPESDLPEITKKGSL